MNGIRFQASIAFASGDALLKNADFLMKITMRKKRQLCSFRIFFYRFPIVPKYRTCWRKRLYVAKMVL